MYRDIINLFVVQETSDMKNSLNGQQHKFKTISPPDWYCRQKTQTPPALLCVFKGKMDRRAMPQSAVHCTHVKHDTNLLWKGKTKMHKEILVKQQQGASATDKTQVQQTDSEMRCVCCRFSVFANTCDFRLKANKRLWVIPTHKVFESVRRQRYNT